MSAPSGGAASSPQCACSNIAIMQLFYELKQQYPLVPDHVVSKTIVSHCHDRAACQSQLEREANNLICQLYPSSSLAGSKHRESRGLVTPQECKNLAARKASEVDQETQTNLTNNNYINSKSPACNKDYNQNLLPLNIEKNVALNTNIHNENSGWKVDKCTKSYQIDNITEDLAREKQSDKILSELNANVESCPTCLGSTSYKIYKSNKVKSDLNKQADGESREVIKKESASQTVPFFSEDEYVKAVRPTSLRIAPERPLSLHGLSEQLQEKSVQTTIDLNESTKNLKQNAQSINSKSYAKETGAFKQNKTDHAPAGGYPLNVSVNLNCRMDVFPSNIRSGQYHDRRSGDFGSPGNYTCVNLTVSTPTSMTQSFPMEERRAHAEEPLQRGFEGQVQITVSPAASHRGYQPAQQTPERHSADVAETTPTNSISVLIQRQRSRLLKLQSTLQLDQESVQRLQREVRALSSPCDPQAVPRLRCAVQRLQTLCQELEQRLDGHTAPQVTTTRGAQDVEDETTAWQCYVCSFLNHALLNKCELCDMPKIILVRADDEITIQVIPRRNNVIQSWII